LPLLEDYPSNQSKSRQNGNETIKILSTTYPQLIGNHSHLAGWLLN
jgi:hypothetical protein